MAITIDSAIVLRAFADHPDAFPSVKVEAGEVARKLLVKEIKAKTTDLSRLSTIHKIVGIDNMQTILDGFSPTELTSLAKKFDPHSRFAKPGEDQGLLRRHVMALADGALEPWPKPQKAKPVKAASPRPKKETPKIGVMLESKVHSGRTSRKKTT